MTTNVPPPSFGATGFTAPAEIDIFNGEMADLNAAFGGNLNQDPSTPQGQLATSLAAVIGYSNDVFTYYTNQTDPNFASGRMQDAIGRIYFIERLGPRPTVVEATVTGAPNTLIPAGSLARAIDGSIYESLGSVVIPIGGSTTVSFANTIDGPIPLAPASLTTIYRTVPGWETVNNVGAGIEGRNTESRAEYEARRLASVATNAVGILPAVRGEVLAVNDVLDAFVYDNPNATPLSYRGVTLPANSLYVAAVGGTDQAVGEAIWRKKAPGCNYYTGNTSVTVLDSNGYSLPYPSYTVVFERPAAVPIFFAVSIVNSVSVPSNAEALIRAAIVASFTGADGSARAGIGSTVYASGYTCPIGALGSWAQVVEIFVGTSGPATDPSVTIDIDQVPSLDPNDITVTLV